MKCAIFTCQNSAGGLGFCGFHAAKAFPGGGKGLQTQGGKELWNANQGKCAYLVVWYKQDNPTNPLDVLLIDAGIYRTGLPAAEPGTRQSEKGVKTKLIGRIERTDSIENAFREAFMFVEQSSSCAEIRKQPTYKRQLNQELAKVLEQVKPLKSVPGR
jgi:hypothetical protein